MNAPPPTDSTDAAPPAVAQDATPSPPAHCKNCGALLSGKYCANCSQAADVHMPTTREILHEVLG